MYMYAYLPFFSETKVILFFFSLAHTKKHKKIENLPDLWLGTH